MASGGPVGMDASEEAEARAKVRHLISQAPTARPPEFVNPLEKIEQLLTCPICLDRYKQPKLLPCQHTFCYPCLESCADSLHRTLKCPECRAEHSIPYDGVKAFQTNYTLTGFLEIHLQATPDSAAEIEEYIHRYNLERCKICDEKADCEVCAHCDRKACKECRQTHMDMLKRDLARLLNQVLTRVTTRIQGHQSESPEDFKMLRGYSSVLLENIVVIDENSEVYGAFGAQLSYKSQSSKQLQPKKSIQKSAGSVRRLSNRIIEASDGLSKGLELLSLNCETTKDEVKEYFHRHQRDLKKREDAFLNEIDSFHATESRLMSNLRDVLEIESSNMSEAVARLDAAIKGECNLEDAELVRLKNTFAEGLEYLRNFQPDADELFNRKVRFSAGEDAARLPQSIATCGELCVLMPQFAGRYLPLEQSYLPRPFRLPLESDQHRARHEDARANDRDRPSSRLTVRDLDEGSIRYRRRQQLEEEAWNRLRGPLDRSAASSSEPERSQQAAPVRHEERKEASKPVPLNLPRPERATPQPKLDVSPAPRSPKPPLSPSPLIRNAEPVKEEAEETRVVSRKPPLPRQASSNDESLNEKVDVIRRAHAERQAASRAQSSDESEGEETSRPRPRIRIVCRAASITREEDSTPSSAPPTAVPIPVTHFAGEHEVPAWLARRRQRFQRSRTNPDLATQFCSQRVQQLLQERSSRLDSSTSTEEERRIRRRSASREANEWRARGCPRTIFGRKGAKEGELNWPRGVCAIGGGAVAVCDSSNHRVCVFDREGKFLRQFGGYGTGRGQLDSAAGIATFKQKLIVSDRYNHRVCIFDMDGNYLNSFGGHGQSNGKFNNPWGVAVDELGTIYVADKDNHRVQMFDKNGLFVGKFGNSGHGPGQLQNPLFIAVNKGNHQVYVSDSSNHRISVFDVQGTFLFSFGSEGFHGGQFKFPRGVAVDSQGNVLVADSGNNRIQVFTSDGEFICTFGTWGGGAGQLKGVEALCVSDGGVVASDRENHRIQIF
ncbi:zinc finger, C3HC4 type [Necator americanus]|uniref:Zinc finger, C3HC4 type n=1 Tax=Necator americanus TaxID=51031 RepID=W2SZG0_NECAM|nr:zinc finger, C3HC4 type [Necator americanus]ETN74361.1 zinc finger, C3HC4 type [Necator americanus]